MTDRDKLFAGVADPRNWRDGKAPLSAVCHVGGGVIVATQKIGSGSFARAHMDGRQTRQVGPFKSRTAAAQEAIRVLLQDVADGVTRGKDDAGA